MNGTTAEDTVPLTSNGATVTTVDSKIDPSIGQAISHGIMPESDASAAPTYASDAGLGETSAGLNPVVPEKSAAPLATAAEPAIVAPAIAPSTSALAPARVPSPEAVTTTTTTIITTTTGPAAEGSGIISPVSSRDGPTSSIGPSAGAAALGVGTGAALGAGTGTAITAAPISDMGVSQDGTTNDGSVTANGAAPAVAGAGVGAATVGGAGAAALASKEEPKLPAMSPKEAKKYNKLLKKEAKTEEKELAAALKSAHSDEKALRKAKKAETQSVSRHDSAIHDEHKTSKSLNKAQLAQDKAAAALAKAKEELEIKKRHTVATNEAYEKTKAKIEELRNTRMANEKDRQRRQASIARAAIQA